VKAVLHDPTLASSRMSVRRERSTKLSRRVALDAQMRELGYSLEKEQLNVAFEMAKLLLGKKKVLEELDMRYIAEQAMSKAIV